jgi:hypothetical protein
MGKSFAVKNTLAYFGTASVKIHDKGIGSIDYWLPKWSNGKKVLRRKTL